MGGWSELAGARSEAEVAMLLVVLNTRLMMAMHLLSQSGGH